MNLNIELPSIILKIAKSGKPPSSQAQAHTTPKPSSKNKKNLSQTHWDKLSSMKHLLSPLHSNQKPSGLPVMQTQLTQVQDNSNFLLI
jgi:hypothetical protein